MSVLPSAAWAEWREIAREDGVVVSERSAPGRRLSEFRGVTDIPAGVFEVLAVISDVKNHPSWMYEVVEAREVQRNSPLSVVVYVRMDVQWPAADRDSVAANQTRILGPDHARVEFEGATNEAAPEIDGVVRIPRLKGHYDLKALDSGGTRVEYQVDADPGGGLPAWMIALTARDNPLNTVRSLRTRVAATRGQYDEFLKRWDPKRQIR